MRRAGLSAARVVEPVAPAAGVPVAVAEPPVDDAPLAPVLVDAPVEPVDPVDPVELVEPVEPVVPVDPVDDDVPDVPVADVPPVEGAPVLPGAVAEVPVDVDGSVLVEPEVDCARASELPATSAAASAPVRSVRWNVWLIWAP